MRPTVAIIDYGINNLLSVYRMMEAAGAKAVVTNKPADLAGADKIVLPGIGHFGQAMQNLSGIGLIQSLAEQVLGKEKPVLGICLGMQLMMHTSEEAAGHYGLCWLPGDVARLHASDALRHKVPHIGWNSITVLKDSRLLRGIPSGSEFYFTHSYTCLMESEGDVVATTNYNGPFASIVEHRSIFAVQFHPEKSRAAGAALLQNFVTL